MMATMANIYKFTPLLIISQEDGPEYRKATPSDNRLFLREPAVCRID